MNDNSRKTTRHIREVVLALAVLLVPFPGLANDKAAAKKHFEAGLALQKKDNFTGAAVEYERSVELYATSGGLYNLANTLKALHRYGEALKAFHRLKSEFASSLDPEMSADVRKEIAQINRSVARLSIRVDRPGAVVKIDGEEHGRSPELEQAVLAPGTHNITVALKGYQTIEHTVALEAQATVELDFGLVEITKKTTEPLLSADNETKQPDKKPILGALGWMCVGVGAAAMAGGVVTGVMAKKKQGELDDICDGFACRDSSFVDIQNSRDKLALTTDILLPVGGVLAATGLVLVIIARTRGKERPAGESAARLTPWMAPGAAGFSYTKSF